DENSSNGTFLRTPQARIFHADLADGDTIYLGETQLRVAIRLSARAAADAEGGTIVSGRVEGKDFTFTLAAFPSRGPREEQLEETRQGGSSASVPPESEKVVHATPALHGPPPRIILRVVEGKDVGTAFEPQAGSTRFTVGRGGTADWVIRDEG